MTEAGLLKLDYSRQSSESFQKDSWAPILLSTAQPLLQIKDPYLLLTSESLDQFFLSVLSARSDGLPWKQEVASSNLATQTTK